MKRKRKGGAQGSMVGESWLIVAMLNTVSLQ
jgi:hypothetical protein